MTNGEKKDIFIKGHKYWNAGVREYWIVDPKNKRVHVYRYDIDAFPIAYTFEDKIPVEILKKDCAILFCAILSIIYSII